MSQNEQNKFSKSSLFKLTYIRDIVIIILIAVITWKLATSNIVINFKDLQASDFIALILALFAIFLSAAFYFKASDTSNKFYDNMYKFTSDVSQMLGRIEAGFGEKLQHLDTSYSNVTKRFDDLVIKKEETIKKVDKEEKDIRKTLDEKEKIISELLEKTTLKDEEKEKYKKEIEKRDLELEDSRKELNIYRNQLEVLEWKLNNRSGIATEILNKDIYTSNKYGRVLSVLSKYINLNEFRAISRENLKLLFNTKIRMKEPEIFEYLLHIRFIDEVGNITDLGYRKINSAIYNIDVENLNDKRNGFG